jgi:hypothetical protein
MNTTKSLDETTCNRFGYFLLKDNIIVKVKPTNITRQYVNGFRSDKYTIIEVYDFFTKQHIDSRPLSVCARRDLFYKETDAFFSEYKKVFGDLTGIYECTNIKGHRIIRYLSNGGHHRNDGAAIIVYQEDGSMFGEAWYVNGQRHRVDGLPAQISYYGNGNKKSEDWYVNGQHHRDGDEPSIIDYYDNGNKRSEIWFTNGRRHRDGDEPYEIFYYENGNKKT